MTPEREKKINKVLKKRQEDIVIVLENVWDPHNISAVMRSCDSVGVQDVLVLNTDIPRHKNYGLQSSASAKKWVTVLDFDSVESCVSYLRDNGYAIYTTHLDSKAKSVYEMDFTQRMALVFGNEKDGVSQEMLSQSDGNFIIPQVGMIQSLNISVACAVSLYEMHRQRMKAGLYEKEGLSEKKRAALYADWSSNFK